MNLMGSVLPPNVSKLLDELPEMLKKLDKLDAFEAMASDITDIKAVLNRLVEIEEARDRAAAAEAKMGAFAANERVRANGHAKASA